MLKLIGRSIILMLRLISVFYRWILGPYIFTDITSHYGNTETITITAIDGTTLTIHCSEKKYLCVYFRWYVKNHTVTTYCITATANENASERHILACKMKYSFPKLLHPWMSSVSQKKAVIEAYIDLLLSNLQDNDK